MLALAACGGSGRRSVALSVTGSAALGAGGSAPAAPAPPAGDVVPGGGTHGRPNIVFVLTDDLAWNLIRYMPHVRAMEREGVTFSRYFVTDSLCCPSRASIFTGRYPHDTKIFSNTPPDGGFMRFHRRGEERQTFATALQSRGYATAMMGKYLNGYHPTQRLGGLTPYVPPGWSEWDVIGDGYPEFGYQMNSNGRVAIYGYQPKDYVTEVLAEKGLSFIDEAAAARRPFMLELATFAPHRPYVPAPRDASAFPGLKAPRDPAFDVANTHPPAWLRYFGPLSAHKIETIDTDFRRRAQSVLAIDRMIAEVRSRLRQLHIAKNTYIVFSSDNGLHMGEHLMMPGKLTAFESDIKVPLIVVGPHVPRGRVVSAMAENIDLCPTFERLGGAPVPSTVEGHSLVQLLHGLHPRRWRKVVLVEHHKPPTAIGDPDRPIHGSGNPPSYEALRMGSSIYVKYVTGEQSYYNLRKDPWELHNVAAQLPRSRIRAMRLRIKRLKNCHTGAVCWRAAGG